MPIERGSEWQATQAWSVGRLARALTDTLSARFGVVTVVGEVSSFTRAASGHCYFALRDASAQLRCVMFRQRAYLLDFDPRDGQQVEIRAVVGLYEPRGDLQLTVESMRQAGQGALLEQFLRLKERLQAEGLFDPERKKPLPAHPRAVGIVTSRQAAALQDVLATLKRRSPQVRVVIYPASVQGVGAALELVQALKLAEQRAEVDVLLLVRGGGAMEDLWPFNDEALARALHACSLPVVSGVGHETDFTIADFAADVRATTPTAAAELCAPALADLRLQALQLARRLQQAVLHWQGREQQRLDRLHLRLPKPGRMLQGAALHLRGLQARLQDRLRRLLQEQMNAWAQRERQLKVLPAQHWAERRARLEALGSRHDQALRQNWALARGKLAGQEQRLALLNPAATLERGYCLAWNEDGSLLHDARQIRSGQSLLLATAQSAVAMDLGTVTPAKHPLPSP
uniref:Exodeoxyribonuclease 7 large subunit (Exodeoxyribonuclease VII large subunit) (Exonuclease VII large subunit) n=1 Tax=mine drainage metagenome TaxID=410659 RepID=E6PT31_9ZZZZ